MLRGFLWVVCPSLYRHLLFAVPLHYLPARHSTWAQLLSREFGWWGIPMEMVDAGWPANVLHGRIGHRALSAAMAMTL